ncbi:hypothetical protein J7F01_16840 [Streptomyces sp. ISL-22]|uniref:hypothetical protein n=1 Tax=unclassified Streptomyces TaxID=2593676 RepID=UPI001BE5C280|nr:MULTISPECIES: hypothetical protein [unclassified Streptomyces]MBT2423412.1 hypothetical protein [Streptomyces sp. ISL-24]MBT2433817.1 hypothetical protein [Streptomyces sp. ISL-22]
MRILRNDELLRHEATCLRDVASRTRLHAQAFPYLGDTERRRVQMAVLHAWIRNRYPVSLQVGTNYVATVVTAVGMAAASATAGVVAAVFATGTGGSARAPWWLFPTAAWAAVCLSTLIVTRSDMRDIVSLFRQLGLRGTIWRVAHPQIAYWFVPGMQLATVVVAAAASWLAVETALSAPTGQQLITAATGLFGAILGLQVGRWIHAVERLLSRRFRQPHRPRPLDAVLVELMAATWACFQGRGQWWDPRNIKIVRARLAVAIETANDTAAVRRRTSITEVTARRQARQFHAALAELIRRHDRAITQVRTAEEYDAITASLRVGVLALATGDLEALMQHSAAEPPTSRAARLVRRAGSSLVLIAFAAVIPLLPGVDGATGEAVRVLLLMTAALALTPASDSASGSIRSALERSLFTKGTP